MTIATESSNVWKNIFNYTVALGDLFMLLHA